MTIRYKQSFLRQLRKLPVALQEETKVKVALFREDPHHPMLKTHKLHGVLQGHWSFSVNYRFRVVFLYESENTVVLLKVGDHDVYR